MKLILEYQRSYTKWTPHIIFERLEEALRKTYHAIEFEYKNTGTYVDIIEYPQPATMGIVNPQTNKKIVISYMDKNRFMCLKDDRYNWTNTVQFIFSPDFKGVQALSLNKDILNGNDHRAFYDFTNTQLYAPRSEMLYPGSYFAYNPVSEHLYRGTRSADRPAILCFRGWLWSARIQVAELIKDESILLINSKVEYEEYLAEMYKYRCILSLNGNAEICNRDFEGMAMGIPLLRPELKQTVLYNPLIPNYHYISFDYEREPLGTAAWMGAPLHHRPHLVADAIQKRWNEVKYDYDFLDYVANNAREWYLQNGTVQANVDILLKQLKLGLLT